MGLIGVGIPGSKKMALLTVVLFAGTTFAGCAQQESVDAKTTCGADGAPMEEEARATLALLPKDLPTRVVDPQPRMLDDQDGLTLEITLGTLMPLTGDLQAYGPDMQRGADLAAAELNNATAAGLDLRVTLVHEDDRSTDTSQAPNTFNKLVNEGATVVVGGAASSITGAILDLAVQNRVVVVTPASTSPALSLERDNKGYFWRVPPSDALQGKVLARLVHDDACSSVSILAVNNPYGNGLGGVFEETFEGLGGSVKAFVKYPEEATILSSEVDRTTAGDPDAVVIIGYPQTGSLAMKEAFRRGALGESVFFFSEGLKDPKFVQESGKDAEGDFIVAGLRGTAPEAIDSPGAAHFKEAFEDAYDHAPGLFGAESYDAVYTAVLAAVCAGSAEGQAIKDEMRRVANMASGDTDVSGAETVQALTLARAGCNINYVGAAGDLDWDERGDPTSGVYSIWRVAEDGSIETVEAGIVP